ncbi:MAG: cation-translocating P-type ATPase [Anaerolineales bacterium]|nr:cation-translocating P-type ATPase [Anaerolineales bacterium]
MTINSSKKDLDDAGLFISDQDDKPCLDVIHEAVAIEPGIVGVQIDPRHQEVAFKYDPQLIAEPEITRLVQQVASPLQHNFETCTMRLRPHGGRACESCALLLENRLHQIPGVRQARASYMGGVLSITYDHGLISSDQLKQKVSQLGIKVAPSSAETISGAEPAVLDRSPLRHVWDWTSQNLEAVFTLITLAAILLAWLAEYAGMLAVIPTALYTLAYITGGTFGLKGGLESLRQRTIDVDLLMVLAALGAAIVARRLKGRCCCFCSPSPMCCRITPWTAPATPSAP